VCCQGGTRPYPTLKLSRCPDMFCYTFTLSPFTLTHLLYSLHSPISHLLTHSPSDSLTRTYSLTLTHSLTHSLPTPTAAVWYGLPVASAVDTGHVQVSNATSCMSL
jgi:hypothetical protein